MFLPLAALLMIVSNIEAVARATQKITAEVIEAVTPAEIPNVQPQPENIAPLPQQEKSDKVTYKGKIVDEAGNPLSDVQIVTDRKFQSITTSTVNDKGEFRIETSPEASIAFLYKGKDAQILGWGWAGNPETLAKMDSNNMVIVLKPQQVINAPTDGDEDVFEVVENMPEFPDGGMPGLMKYLCRD